MPGKEKQQPKNVSSPPGEEMAMEHRDGGRLGCEKKLSSPSYLVDEGQFQVATVKSCSHPPKDFF